MRIEIWEKKTFWSKVVGRRAPRSAFLHVCLCFSGKKMKKCKTWVEGPKSFSKVSIRRTINSKRVFFFFLAKMRTKRYFLFCFSSYLWDNLLDDVDFNHYRDDILEYLNDFDHYASSSMMSTINFEELVSMIQHRMLLMKKEQIVKVLENFLPSIRPMTWTRLEFIGFLPSLIYMESLVDPSRTLFRFRDNSILDCHMKNSVVIWLGGREIRFLLLFFGDLYRWKGRKKRFDFR